MYFCFDRFAPTWKEATGAEIWDDECRMDSEVALIVNSCTTLSHTALSHTQLCHRPLCHTPLCHTQLCHTQLCHKQLCHTQLFHTQLCHRQSFTHNSFTHNLSHTTLSLTTFHTQLFRTQLFTYNFSNYRSSTISFVLSSFSVPLQPLFLIIGRSWLVGLSGPFIFPLHNAPRFTYPNTSQPHDL